MRYRLLLIAMLLTGIAHAQTPDSLILELKSINAKHQLISNRAMNIFLSEAAGYYLSTPDDFTLYKNSIIASSADRSFALYHNLRQPAGADSSIRSFLSIGAKANLNRTFDNRFGLLIKQTWVGKPKIKAASPQTQTMDALRANILYTLVNKIRRKTAEENAVLDSIENTGKAIAGQKFNSDLIQEIEYDFAHDQAETLAQTFNYEVIAFHWTSISAYIPLVTENFETIQTDTIRRHAWPIHLNLTHTRLWEGSTFGRLFLTLAGDLTLNNSRDGFLLARDDNDYLGSYQTFLTPSVTGRVAWLPSNSHIGISFLTRQAIGQEHTTDAILGFPIVLIDKKAEPAINFEFQVRFNDLGHTIPAGNGLPGHTVVALTMGVPFSKIAF